MEQINTVFGKMPMTEEDYATTYEEYTHCWKANDIVGLHLHANKMLMSQMMIIELQQRIIEELEKSEVKESDDT